jgi:predicted nucleic acid-binding protein
MADSLYVDTSAVLRATLEVGTTPDVEARIVAAETLITSRLALVESCRALIRACALARISDLQRSGVEHQLDQLWSRCHIWEITRTICDHASVIAPRTGLRTLDAIHLATFLQARRRLGAQIQMLTTDERLQAAAMTC